MGLLQAVAGSIGGTLADQWKDFYTVPDGLPATAALFAAVPRGSGLDEPIAESWPAVTRWDDRMERDWSTFVSRLGRAVESRRCNRLDRCLRDPEANSLWDAQTDAHLRLDSIDCAVSASNCRALRNRT